MIAIFLVGLSGFASFSKSIIRIHLILFENKRNWNRFPGEYFSKCCICLSKVNNKQLDALAVHLKIVRLAPDPPLLLHK